MFVICNGQTSKCVWSESMITYFTYGRLFSYFLFYTFNCNPIFSNFQSQSPFLKRPCRINFASDVAVQLMYCHVTLWHLVAKVCVPELLSSPLWYWHTESGPVRSSVVMDYTPAAIRPAGTPAQHTEHTGNTSYPLNSDTETSGPKHFIHVKHNYVTYIEQTHRTNLILFHRS